MTVAVAVRTKWNAKQRIVAGAKVRNGLMRVEQGGTYMDAAQVAGYADPFQFSRACFDLFGERPRELVKQPEWVDAVAEKMSDLELEARGQSVLL